MPHHGPFGPHGFMGPHGPFGPHHEPHGFNRPREGSYGKDRALTESNVKDRNIKGVSQIRFQQTASRSENGDNYEYFESKHVLKEGRVNQPITVHHRRGGNGDNETQRSQSVNRSSSYNKTSSQINRNNANLGSNTITTKYTQKTTNIRVNEGNNEGKGIFTEYKKYTQKGTGVSGTTNVAKYGANTTNASRYGANTTTNRVQTQYGANTVNSGASSINKSKYVAGTINTTKYTKISSRNAASGSINKPQSSAGNINASKYNTGSNNASKSGAGSSIKSNYEINRNSSKQEQYSRKIEKSGENDVLCQTFDESEFEIIFCPVHGKQYVKKKKFRQSN
jgi:hypothetical protein